MSVTINCHDSYAVDTGPTNLKVVRSSGSVRPKHELLVGAQFESYPEVKHETVFQVGYKCKNLEIPEPYPKCVYGKKKHWFYGAGHFEGGLFGLNYPGKQSECLRFEE